MSPIAVLSQFTPLPARLARLLDLAYNLWWAWHPEARHLFQDIEPDLWDQVYHNPIKFLREVRQTQLEAAAADPAYLQRFDAVLAAFDAYMTPASTWFRSEHLGDEKTIAYFSMEFGLHESLPIYSGGLGVLSGDHIKEASDIDLPLVAVGFIYPQGYFRQQLDANGWQEAYYEKLNFADVLAQPALTPEGQEVVVSVDLPGRTIYAKAYRIQVGRVPLFLMDTDIHPNAPSDRQLGSRLYGGDQEMRIVQEIVLGIGGVRMLRALGIKPGVWHMNEGHAAFLVLELLREKIAAGVSYADARLQVAAGGVFTTHTPVPAGHDAFSWELMDKYFGSYWPQMGLSRDEFLSIARQEANWGPTFSMTVLAIAGSNRHNGVSQLHGEVSRKMWQWLWPDKPVAEVPISAITNGVHSATWLASQMAAYYTQYLGAGWYDRLDDPATWAPLRDAPAAELWAIHSQLKHDLVAFARKRAEARYVRMSEAPAVWPILDPDALTLGFARRFATYKRATMIFTDRDRLKKLLNDPARPMQILFAGKAHPADGPGKQFIQQVYWLSKEPGFAGKILFIEEYDMHVARHLVHGADVWLNTPRRPYEASGTSGEKAALNGLPNLSVLDGWWAEGYNGKNGWAVGEGKEYANPDEQDWQDAQSLYATLEQQVVPLFYNRGADGVPEGWVTMMKEAIISIAPMFSTRRMLKDYTEQLYIPAMHEATALVTARQPTLAGG
ncbi:MAG TPA: alpha-glucan family phosphorylase [Chloroflexia bacterium]|nr:alpha-glucan family phosphorylase [Chloroflexia bacterium]